MRARRWIAVVLCVVAMMEFVGATAYHTGGTDSNGGHWNHSTGEYHYHHGYPEHQHTNGVCPYEFDGKIGQTTAKAQTQTETNSIERKSKMFWQVVLMIAMWLVGSFWTSFGIIMPLIVIFTSNPLIAALIKRGLIDAKAARKRNGATIGLWVTIDIIGLAIMFMFANRVAWIGLAIGFLFAMLKGIKKLTPATQTNKDDFCRSYARFIDSQKGVEAAAVVSAYPEEPSQEYIELMNILRISDEEE